MCGRSANTAVEGMMPSEAMQSSGSRTAVAGTSHATWFPLAFYYGPNGIAPSSPMRRKRNWRTWRRITLRREG